MTEWTNATTHDEWSLSRQLGRGGQGTVTQARNVVTGVEGCVKILNSQKDMERRARFAREAIAYDTCRHIGVPRLLQSNALHHESRRHTLFIATEFIPGDTLSQRLRARGPLGLQDAALLITSLLNILEYLHESGWVHRDIKPDNIVLRGNDVGAPVLLDFGLCFKEGITQRFMTEVGQELGNRFLRLPELGINSPTKQDARSDIAFAGGILFYALTGLIPAYLSDEKSRMPHQTPAAISKLSSDGESGRLLLGFFDRAFSPDPQGRFPHASGMLTAFKNVIAKMQTVGGYEHSDDLTFIDAHVRRQTTQMEVETASHLDSALQAVRQVHTELAAILKPTFLPRSAAHPRSSKGVRLVIGFGHFSRKEERFAPGFIAEAVGSEVIIRVDDDVLFRTDLSLPVFEDACRSVIREFFLKGVRGLIEDPTAQVATRGFFNTKPLTQLRSARSLAAEQGKLLFLVIFDASHATYSDLDYVLGAFLGYELTRELVDAHFVVALVPSFHEDAAALVPKGERLECALWLVLTPDGLSLKQEHVYANRDVGLRRVQEAINSWAK